MKREPTANRMSFLPAIVNRVIASVIPALVVAAVFWTAPYGISLAQETGEAPETQEPDSEELEEVIVSAPRSLSAFRAEILAAENSVLSSFNAANPDNDYDVNCERGTPLGSLIPRRVCSLRIVDELTLSATQQGLSGTGFASPEAEIRYHQRIFEEKLATLAGSNPQLYEALKQYYLLKTEYDERRGETSDDRFLSE